MPAVLERETGRRLGSDAFNLEYRREFPKQALYEDIVSYIGEYRLRVQKYDYKLDYSSSGLSDPNTGESMLQKARATIKDRTQRGLPIHREEAELQALSVLRNVAPFAKSGDTIFWASPPGPKEEGYGDYGFLFVGRIGQGRNVDMTAIHIDNPTLEQYSTAMTILTGVNTDYRNADKFLSDPKVVKESMSPQIVDKVLEYVFPYKVNEDEKKKFGRIIDKLNPVIEDLIDFVKTGTSEEKLKAFYALENYALQLKAEEDRGEIQIYSSHMEDSPIRLADIIHTHGYEPPKASGSCGSTSSSNSVFSSPLDKLLKDLGIETESACSCPDGNMDNHYHCPGCNKRYADETNKTERTKECPCGFEFGC